MITEHISVMIVESQPIMRTALSATLAAEGMTVLAELNSSRQALQTAMTLKPNVVLLAVGTPGCGELESISVLREQLPASTIIALVTGEIFGQDRMAADQGAHLVLTKSTPLAKLLNTVIETSRKSIYPVRMQVD